MIIPLILALTFLITTSCSSMKTVDNNDDHVVRSAAADKMR